MARLKSIANCKLLLYLLCGFWAQFLFSQEDVSVLLDSLAKTSSSAEKTHLGLRIASLLANEDWERAQHYIEIAKTNASETNSPEVIANFYQELGDIYSYKDALDIALENYLEAYKHFENQTSDETSKLENNLAITYARTANHQKALYYFEKVYQYQRAKGNKQNQAVLLNNIGRIWMEKEVDSALYYFQKSLKLAEEIDYPELKRYLYTNIGTFYARKDDTLQAKRYYTQAVKAITPQTPLDNVGWIFNDYSEYFLQKKQYDSAIYYSEKAVKALDSATPFSFQQQRAVRLLYRSYIANGQFEKASNYFEKYIVISDSLNLEDKRVNVERLLIEEEYRNRDKIRELEQSKQQSRNYIILLVLLAVLLFLGILLLRFRNKLKQTKLEKQLIMAKEEELQAKLQLKNKELIGKAMIEVHRTEIIEDVLKDLKKVKLRAAKKETQEAIDYIATRLKRDTSSTNIWKEFEVRFEQVHESFYKNLAEKHPDLTPRERRLAALLKLNLTSKEIAQITGQSLKSVENARTRLRRKLNITNFQTDLSAYLASFS